MKWQSPQLDNNDRQQTRRSSVTTGKVDHTPSYRNDWTVIWPWWAVERAKLQTNKTVTTSSVCSLNGAPVEGSGSKMNPIYRRAPETVTVQCNRAGSLSAAQLSTERSHETGADATTQPQ